MQNPALNQRTQLKKSIATNHPSPISSAASVQLCGLNIIEDLKIHLYVLAYFEEEEDRFYEITWSRWTSFKNTFEGPCYAPYDDREDDALSSVLVKGSRWIDEFVAKSLMPENLSHYVINTESNHFEVLSDESPVFNLLSEEDVQKLNLAIQTRVKILYRYKDSKEVEETFERIRKGEYGDDNPNGQ